MKRLLDWNSIWPNAISILRIWIGVVFIYYSHHFYDPFHMSHFIDFLNSYHIPFPSFSAYLSKTVEFFGGICLVLGIFTRIACVFMIINMSVATFVTQRGEVFGDGIHTFLLLLISLVILLSELDKFTLDRLIWKKVSRK